MNKHHLVLGELIDYITGEVLEDTHDERYRQAISRILVEKKGYEKQDIIARKPVMAEADSKKAIIKADYVIELGNRVSMLVKYGPGSLVTRRRPSISASRLLKGYEIPVVVVTNGVSAEIIDGHSGIVIQEGLERIPTKEELLKIIREFDFKPVSPKKLEMEARILYAYEVDDSCPCDDTICRL
jgi:hypothetical protein